MLHKSKGKYKWQRKAIYSVDWSLSPVILSYLEKLHETIKDRETIGIPHYYFQKQAEVQGIPIEDSWNGEVDLDAAHQLRWCDLEELIYVFNYDNKPNILEYDFKTKSIFGDVEDLERDRYYKDVTEWQDRRKKGQELFGQIYSTLDW